mgnify:FL=1
MYDYKENKYDKDYPSLYDAFELGDRVKRTLKDKNGNNTTYKGIVLAIEENGIEIYWDTQNGKYRPNNMNIAFSHCELDEIFNVNKKYSLIEKD